MTPDPFMPPGGGASLEFLESGEFSTLNLLD
jgi:3-phosphoglycerate kinase